MNTRDDPAAQFAARLREIADTLGVTVDQFHNPPASQDVADMLAILRASAAITDGQGLQRVLRMAQREASRCQGVEGSSDHL